MADQPEGPDGPRPTRKDQKGFERLQAGLLDRSLAEARVWRNGYALLGSGFGAILALVGNRLDDATPWGWRLALSLTLGGGLVLLAVALWFVLTVEGGKQESRLDLRDVVRRHNSFELYQADQAAAAIQRTNVSKRWAFWGAALGFLGLLCTLWVSPAPEVSPPAPAASATVSVITPSHVTASARSTGSAMPKPAATP